MAKDPQREDVFEVFDTRYTLRRYPTRHRKELRAWDTADLYLLHTLAPMLSEVKTIGIVHDHFGALTVPLARHNPVCYGDSWMSRRAIELNIQANQISSSISFEEHLEDFITLHDPPDCVVGRVPKSISQLTALLKKLNRWLAEDTLLMLAGMDKHLSRGQYRQLEACFGPAHYLPGVRKARIWQARCNPSLCGSQPLGQSVSREIIVPNHQLTLTALPNVFSHDHLDQGSAFLLSHLTRLPARRRVADMACGYGVLGLAYLKINPETHMTFCDESFQAVASTELNQRRNLPQAQVNIYADDGLKQHAQSSLDLVICNPPFHQGHTVSIDIAHSLFRDAYRALDKTGELWIVANRHLGYHHELKRVFHNCTTVTSNAKFVILRAIKSEL